MIQFEAIKIVSRKIIEDNVVECILLEEDINSICEDATMIVCIDEIQKTKLISKLENYLLAYDDVMQIDSDLLNSCFTIVFDNAVRIKIKVLDINNLKVSKNTKIIYDEFDVLKNKDRYQNLYMLRSQDVGQLINSFSSKLFDFRDSYYRNNTLTKLLNVTILCNKLAVFLHYTYDKENALLGEQDLLNLLPEEVKVRFNRITSKLRFDTILECVKLIIVMLDPYIVKLPIEVVQFINIDYYLLAKKIILSI